MNHSKDGSSPAAKPRILVVDDTPVNLAILMRALEQDYRVTLCQSASEALAELANKHFDLILLDVVMPEISGFEAFELIRKLPHGENVPVVFITASDDHNSETKGLVLGAIDFIFKPIRIELVRLRIRNILKLYKLSENLASSEQRLRFVMEATGEGVWDWNISDGKVTHNASWCEILGLDETFMVHPVEEFIERLHPDDSARVQKSIQNCLNENADYVSEHRMRLADGSYIWVADRGRVVEWDSEGLPRRMVGSMKNIEDRKRSEAEIYRLAFFDTLTNLPNRRLLHDRLEQALLKAQRSSNFGALMFLDMDNFKRLNDTHGHAMGDALLIEVARRLEGNIRAQDTVSRLGGDEFVVLLEGLGEDPQQAQEHARQVGNKLLAALNQTYQLGNLAYSSTPSIGVALFSGKKDTVESLLGRSDKAMYQAKLAGRNTLRVAY